tara:strand:- start:59 stop:775 length:717 start_codon:yes stop_codon:yes gene_type:complete
MNFSLVIPCYNEAENIPILIKKYRKLLKFKNSELILVNNGSIDNTEKVFKKLKKFKNIKTYRIKKNIGFGYGLRKGLSKAKNNHIIYSHADPEVDPNDIFKAIKILSKKENCYKKKIFIKGNRVNKLKNNWTLGDIFFSVGLTIFSTLIFRKYLFDIHGQPVLFSKKLLSDVSFYPNDFSIDLAMYLAAKKNRYEIIRFPVNFNKKARIYGTGSSSTFLKQLKGTFEQVYNSFLILTK